MYPWQRELLERIEGGVKPGEMTIMMSGRRVGKSQFSAQAFKRLWDDIYKERPVTDLILTETRVSGSRYYCVEPEGGNWAEMSAWCRKTFGDPGDMWNAHDWVWPENARWMENNRKFWFRNLKDRDWFIIKWQS